MNTPETNEPNALTLVDKDQLTLYLAQALSELTNRTACVRVTSLDPMSSERAALTLEVLFQPENPEEGTEH